MTTPLHGAVLELSHYRGETANPFQSKFVFCPIGNIVSWNAGDFDHKWCHWCKKYFTELSQ